MAKKWTKKEIEFLKKNVNEPYEVLTRLIPYRTLEAIIGKKDKLKLRRKTSFFWTKKQDYYLIKNYLKTTIEILKSKLNKSKGAIYARVNRLRKKGFNIKDKNNLKEFLSNYWKKRYKTDKDLIIKHKAAIGKLWANDDFRRKHKASIKKLFSNQEFYNKHKADFIKRRNSKKFRLKQSRAASKMLRETHKDPEKHKKLLLNLRKNPSNQQLFAINYLRKIFGYKNVGCNDWKILDNQMEVDIPIYPFKIAVEWDGEYWHHEIEGIKRKDNLKNKFLLEKGWSIIRVTSPSHYFQSTSRLQERLDILVGIIMKILEDDHQLN